MSDKLDIVLRSWASRRTGGDKPLAVLESDIKMKLREASCGTATAFPETSAFSPWGRLAWFSLGVAAALIVTLAIVRLPPAAEDAETLALIQSSKSVQHLFDEVNRLFAGNLRWVAQSDGEVELGIDSSKDEANINHAKFAVHIAVVSRSGNGGPWKKVWESDILTRSEEAISIVPDRKHDDRVSLWIYPVEKGRFAVDSRLSLNAPVRIYSDSSDVVQDGKPKAIAVITIGAMEYRVYQTVTCLKPKESGPC